jgi:hypothetical protein
MLCIDRDELSNYLFLSKNTEDASPDSWALVPQVMIKCTYESRGGKSAVRFPECSLNLLEIFPVYGPNVPKSHQP